jgi:N-acetylglutamate synthase-like GNAT family acetyltransferase
MSSNIQIRRATPQDAPAIATVLRRVFLDYRHHLSREALVVVTPSAEEICQRMTEGTIWVALQEGEIVGTVGAIPKSDGAYLRSMAILPCARGQGIGKMLLQHAEAFAQEIAQNRVYLVTASFLNRSVRLYEKFGFERTDDPAELFDIPVFTMAKRLN